MSDDQVGAQARLGPDRVVDRPALLEVVPVNLGPGNAVARAMLGRQRHLVQLERLEHLGRRGRAARKALHQEAAPPAVAPGQLEAEPAELGGESVVDEQDVHGRSPLAATRAREPLGEPRQTDILGIAFAHHRRRGIAQRPVRGEVGEHGQRLPRQAIRVATVDQEAGSPGCDDFAVRLGVGGQDDTARRHRLQQRAGDRVGPARGDVQVAGGQDLGHDRGRRRPQEPEPIGIERGLLCHQVSGVITVMKFDVQTAPDDRVADDDTQARRLELEARRWQQSGTGRTRAGGRAIGPRN